MAAPGRPDRPVTFHEADHNETGTHPAHWHASLPVSLIIFRRGQFGRHLRWEVARCDATTKSSRNESESA